MEKDTMTKMIKIGMTGKRIEEKNDRKNHPWERKRKKRQTRSGG